MGQNEQNLSISQIRYHFFFVLLHFSIILLIIGMDFKMDWSNMTSPATLNRCFILKIDVSMPLDWH